MKYLVILLFICSNSIFSKDYTLKWYSFVTVLDKITYEDKSVYRIVRSDGSWEDSEGFYGSLKCMGPNKISSTNEVYIFDHLVALYWFVNGCRPTVLKV